MDLNPLKATILNCISPRVCMTHLTFSFHPNTVRDSYDNASENDENAV